MPPPAVEEIRDPTSTSEFEDLFLDEKSISESLDALSNTKTNIELGDLLDDNTPRPAKIDGDSVTHAKAITYNHNSDAALPAPSEADYFSAEKVNESSLTIRTQQENTEPKAKITNSAVTVQSQAASSSQKNTATDIITTTDDSISEILHSINFEGEENATASSAKLTQQTAVVGAAKKAEKAVCKLSLVEGEHDTHEYILKDNTSIGRSPSNDITLKAPKVSRQHAAINMYNDQHIIIDLKSSNGVYVNGTKVDESVLNSGDEVSIGGYKFLFTKE